MALSIVPASRVANFAFWTGSGHSSFWRKSAASLMNWKRSIAEELCFNSSFSGLNESFRTARSAQEIAFPSVISSHLVTAGAKKASTSNPSSLMSIFSGVANTFP